MKPIQIKDTKQNMTPTCISGPSSASLDFGNTARDILLKIDLEKEIKRAKDVENDIYANAAKFIKITVANEGLGDKFKISLLNKDSVELSSEILDIDTEFIINSARLDYVGKKIIFERKDGSEFSCDISDLIDDLDSRLNAEAEARIEADNQLSVKVAEEAQIRFDRDEDLQNQLNDVNQALSDERQVREEADTAIDSKLTSEIFRSKEEDETLRNELNVRAEELNRKIDETVEAESEERKTKDEDLQSQLNDIDNALTLETNNRIEADRVLDDKLTSEISRSTEADETLRNELESEIERSKRVDAGHSQHLSELDSKVEQEVSDRETDVSRVENLLSQEVARAQQTEGNLLVSITSETTRAQGAESTLRTDLAIEVARATAAESVLDSSKVDKEEGKSLMSSEEHSKLAGISVEANKVIVLGSTPNGYIVIDGDKTLVYDDTEIRELIAAKETGWVIDTKSQIVGTEDSLGNFTNATVIGSLDLSLLKVGDNIYVKDPTTPDYWISGKTGNGTAESPYIFSLNVLDTKIDLSNYYTKPEILALLNDKADKTDVVTLTTRVSTAEGTLTTIDGRVSAIEDDYLKAADKNALTALITAETTRATDAEFAITQRLTTAESDINSLTNRVTSVEIEVSAIKDKPAYAITAAQISDWNNEVGAKALAQTKSTVSVSATGAATEEVQYITVDGAEKKIKGVNISVVNDVLIIE